MRVLNNNSTSFCSKHKPFLLRKSPVQSRLEMATNCEAGTRETTLHRTTSYVTSKKFNTCSYKDVTGHITWGAIHLQRSLATKVLIENKHFLTLKNEFVELLQRFLSYNFLK